MAELTSIELGRRIREARDRRGLNQADLGERMGLDRTAVNKIESGTRRVTALELSAIADALRVRMTSFFAEPVAGIVAHRSTLGLEVVDSQIDQLLDDLVVDVELVQELGALPHRSGANEPFPVPQSAEEAEKLAWQARNLLKIEQDIPLRDLQKLFGEAGLLVFTRDLGNDTADGGTVLLRDGTGVAIINSAMKVGRRRLTAAHEFGHFLVQDQYARDWDVTSNEQHREAMIDRFARALLIPKQTVGAFWEVKFTDGLRAAAVITASNYRVDMATLARRLTELELIDGAQADRIRQFQTNSSDMIEYDLHSHDDMAKSTQPRMFQQAVLRLVRAELISTDRALDLLWDTIDEADLPEPRAHDEKEIWEFVS